MVAASYLSFAVGASWDFHGATAISNGVVVAIGTFVPVSLVKSSGFHDFFQQLHINELLFQFFQILFDFFNHLSIDVINLFDSKLEVPIDGPIVIVLLIFMCLIKFSHGEKIIEAVKLNDNLIQQISVSLLICIVELLSECID